MEYKVRKESQSLVQRVFITNERRGVVRSYQIPSLLRAINPEMVFENDELKRVIADCDPEGNLSLDYDSFTRVVMHFLVRHVRQDIDEFSHKHVIGLNDFIHP